MLDYIKKILITTICMSVLFIPSGIAEQNVTMGSHVMFSSGITLAKVNDIHMGTVHGFYSPIPGFLSLDTASNVFQEELVGVTHLGGGVSGKVSINAPIGQELAIWVTQPNVGSCGSGTLWGFPKCKILRADDSTVAQPEKICSTTDHIQFTVTDSPSYLYLGGILSFSYGHTCHIGLDGQAVSNQDNATGDHIVHVGQQ